MSDVNNPSDWVKKAEEDYAIAVLLLRRKKPLTYGVTFHAQQCAEKYIKALLVLHGQIPAKTHDLVALSNQCLQVGIILPIHTKELQLLTDYAVRVRYPGDDPTPDDAKQMLEIAKAVRKYAKPLL
jgi:HEPN domain-containing protein